MIDDEQALDPEWLTFSTTSKPDKNAIKEALKAGRQITGAQLLNRRSWRIHGRGGRAPFHVGPFQGRAHTPSIQITSHIAVFP